MTSYNCDKFFYNDTFFCNCGCGGEDPDCANSDLSVIGCDGFRDPVCNEGVCAEDTGMLLKLIFFLW